jgi:hypothetical protein
MSETSTATSGSAAATPNAGAAQATAGAQAQTKGQGQAQTGSKETQQQQQQQQAAAERRLEKFSFKIDGQDVEEEIDLNDKEALKKRLQLAHGAERRITQAKSAQTQALQIIKQLRENPAGYFASLGPKGKEIAEQILLQNIQNEMLTEEQKKAIANEQRLKQYEEKEKSAEENQKKQQQAEQDKKIAEGFQKTIIDALEKVGLPKKTPNHVRRMAKLLHTSLNAGIDLTAEELASEYKNEFSGDLKAAVADMDGAQLLAFFGPEIAKKIRAEDIKQLQENQKKLGSGGPRPAPTGGSGGGQPQKPMSIDEWKENLAKRYGP